MSPAPGSEDRLLDAALGIAGDLAGSGTRTREELTWTGPVVTGRSGNRPVIAHGDIGGALYDGTAGIAVMLTAAAQAAATRDRPEAAALADAAFAAARAAVRSAYLLLSTGRIGLYDGATGGALAAATAGSVLDHEPLRRSAGDLASRVAEAVVQRTQNPEHGEQLDLLGGVSGTCLGLLSIRTALAGQDGTAGGTVEVEVEALRAATARLTAAAVPQTWGSAWPSFDGTPSAAPLLGLGHGAAGISLALAEMARTVTAAAQDEADLPDVARQGLEYERGWYEPDEAGWPDLRAESSGGRGGRPAMMSAWCHGAIGIGLSRARLLGRAGVGRAERRHPALIFELSASLQAARTQVVRTGTALRTGVRSDCTPCHGLAGVVELFLAAEVSLGGGNHGRAALAVAELIVEQGDGGSWPCGIEGAGQMPGLMTGTAGVALSLLRAGNLTTVASPLVPGGPW